MPQKICRGEEQLHNVWEAPTAPQASQLCERSHLPEYSLGQINSGRLRNDLRNVPLFDPENNLADAISRRADSLEEQQGLTYQAAFDIANIQVYQEWFGNGKRKRIATDRLYSKDSDSDSEPLRGKHVLQKKPPNPPEVSNCSFFSCCCC